MPEPKKRAPRLAERFAMLEAEFGPGACWPWPSTLARDGYGITTRGQRAHRVSFTMNVGPIPDGHDVHHTCENKRCVNWHHLESAAKAEHMRKHWPAPAIEWKPRTLGLVKHQCKNGHTLSGDNVRVSATRRRCRACDRLHHRRSA